MDSILESIKKLLGIARECEDFDQQLISNINSVFLNNLRQLGIGPKKGFMINGKQYIWSDFIDDPIKVESVKMYIYFKVRLSFDPPSNANLTSSIEKQIAELEWRLTNADDISSGGDE